MPKVCCVHHPGRTRQGIIESLVAYLYWCTTIAIRIGFIVSLESKKIMMCSKTNISYIKATHFYLGDHPDRLEEQGLVLQSSGVLRVLCSEYHKKSQCNRQGTSI